MLTMDQLAAKNKKSSLCVLPHPPIWATRPGNTVFHNERYCHENGHYQYNPLWNTKISWGWDSVKTLRGTCRAVWYPSNWALFWGNSTRIERSQFLVKYSKQKISSRFDWSNSGERTHEGNLLEVLTPHRKCPHRHPKFYCVGVTFSIICHVNFIGLKTVSQLPTWQLFVARQQFHAVTKFASNEHVSVANSCLRHSAGGCKFVKLFSRFTPDTKHCWNTQGEIAQQKAWVRGMIRHVEMTKINTFEESRAIPIVGACANIAYATRNSRCTHTILLCPAFLWSGDICWLESIVFILHSASCLQVACLYFDRFTESVSWCCAIPLAWHTLGALARLHRHHINDSDTKPSKTAVWGHCTPLYFVQFFSTPSFWIYLHVSLVLTHSFEKLQVRGAYCCVNCRARSISQNT